MISPFGVEHAGLVTEIGKIDMGYGHYVSATEAKQKGYNHQLLQEVRANSAAKTKREYPAGRDLSAAYHKHGLERTPGTLGLLRRSGTTPSQTHKMIEYGHTVPHKMRAELDRDINPALAGKLKHKVAIHHVPEHYGSIASAVGAHVTTGGKGHVLLGGDFQHGQEHLGVGVTRSQVLNHELVHASLKEKNPTLLGRKDWRKAAAGEEARADMKSGADLYHRHGAPVTDPEHFNAVRSRLREKGVQAPHFGPKPMDRHPGLPHFAGGSRYMDAGLKTGLGVGVVLTGLALHNHLQAKKKTAVAKTMPLSPGGILVRTIMGTSGGIGVGAGGALILSRKRRNMGHRPAPPGGPPIKRQSIAVGY